MAQELLKAGDHGGAIWVALAGSRHVEVRRAAVAALGHRWRWSAQHAAEVGAALRARVDDADGEVQRSLAIALVRRVGPDSPEDPVLRGILASDTPAATAAASEIRWASALPDWLATALETGAPGAPLSPDRCGALLAHGHAKGRALDRAREMLLQRTAPVRDRVPLMEGLALSPVSAAALCRELLSAFADSRNREERYLCAVALASIRDAPVTPSLPLLEPRPQDDAGVRLALAFARSRLLHVSPDEPLVREARGSVDLPVRMLAAQVDLAADPASRPGVEGLRECLHSDVPGLRCMAIAGLTRLGVFPGDLLEDVERIAETDGYWPAAQAGRRFLEEADREGRGR